MTGIKDWLQSKDYLDGIRLYLKYGQDKDLKRLLTEEAKTPYKEAKLEKALRNVLQGQEVQEKPVKVEAKSWPADAAPDDVLKSLRSAFLTHFKKMQDLRSQLLLIPTTQERGEAAFEILRLDALCDEIFVQRDHYLRHKQLPDIAQPGTEIVVDPKKAYQRMEVLKRYIRREDANLQKNPGHAKAAIRKVQWIQEFNTYAKKFGEELIDAVQA